MPSRGQQLGKLLNPTGDIVETSLPPKIETFSQSVSNTGKVEKAALGNDVATIEEVSDITLLTASGNSVGDQRVVGNNLYIWNGSGWYRIALINETPTWDAGGQPETNYILSSDSPQTATTITLAATDPDGLPITYSHIIGGSMDSMATISQDSSVFTITPKTEAQLDSEAGPHTGTITFRASDGVNILPYVSSFTLTFTAPTPGWDSYSLTGDTLRQGSLFRRYMGSVVEMSGNGRYAAVSNGMDPYSNSTVQIWHDTDGNGSWTYQTEYSEGSSTDLGSDMSFDDEGETLAVGRSGNNAVRIYTRSGSTWSYNQELTGSNNFGLALAMSGDGLVMGICEPTYSSNKGRVTFWSRPDKSTNWSSTQTLSSLTGLTANNSYLGRARSWRTNYSSGMEMNTDGTRCIISCSGYNNSSDSRAFLIVRADTSTNWQNGSAYVKYYHNTAENAVSDVSISGDGNTVVIGRHTSTAGEFRIFDVTTLPGTGTISPTQTITFSGLSSSEKGTWNNSYFFGSRVSTNRDGKTVVTSAQTYQASYLNSMGSVYIFRKNDNTGNWEWKDVIEPSSTSSTDRFGSDIDISSDGTHIAVGEYLSDDGTTENGVFYIYKAIS